jgi:hypothetical protein
MKRSYKATVYLLSFLLIAFTFGRMLVGLRNGSGLNHVSGVWAALADDLRNGTFYRPLMSDLGFGGTRFFPLHFALHAAIANCGFDFLDAGHALGIISTVGFIAVGAALARRLGMSHILAVIVVAFSVSGTATQLALVSVRGDSLPAMLSLSGVAVCARGPARTSTLILASLFFVGAFAAKVTSIAGLAAIVVFFALTRQLRKGIFLLALSCAGFALVLLFMGVASHGTVISVFRTCALGGARSLDLARGPMLFIDVLAKSDPILLVLFVLAAACVISSPMGFMRSGLSGALFVTTAIVTIGIFGSPGIDYNHLIDLNFAAVLVLAAHIQAHGFAVGQQHVRVIRALIVLLLLLGIRYAYLRFHMDIRESRLRDILTLAQHIKPGERPVLAFNPWLPILCRERPFLLDSMMVRVAGEREPTIRAKFVSLVEQGGFRAVVLTLPQDLDVTRSDVGGRMFVPGFMDALNSKYRLQGRYGENVLYLPRD